MPATAHPHDAADDEPGAAAHPGPGRPTPADPGQRDEAGPRPRNATARSPQSKADPTPRDVTHPGPRSATNPEPRGKAGPSPRSSATDPSPQSKAHPSPRDEAHPGPRRSATDRSPQSKAHPSPRDVTHPGPRSATGPEPRGATGPGPRSSATDPSPQSKADPSPHDEAHPGPRRNATDPSPQSKAHPSPRSATNPEPRGKAGPSPRSNATDPSPQSKAHPSPRDETHPGPRSATDPEPRGKAGPRPRSDRSPRSKADPTPRDETHPGPRGAAGLPLGEQRDRALAAWDAFRRTAAAADPDAPSRVPGWTGRDVVAHLASWPEEPLLTRLLAEARGERAAAAAPLDQDAANAALIAAHRDATRDDLLAALDAGRARVDAAFAAVAADPALGTALTGSQVGPVPLLTQLGAIAYELAVHALDLAPCGGTEPDPGLLDAGLLALADITGALAARHGVAADTALAGPDGGWAFTASADGWTVRRVAADERGIPAVRAASTALLLDTSAGRRSVPPLLVKRDLRLDNLAGLLALAPLLDHVPGLPGGAALRVAAGWLGGIGRTISRLQR